jgi:hypothetical protein
VALGDAVLGATMKVYGMMSGRRSTTDIRACQEAGHIDRAPSYNTLFRCVENPTMLPLLRALVDESAKPLTAIEKTFAVDRTGFSTQPTSDGSTKNTAKRSAPSDGFKAHAMVGTLNNVITAVEATESNVNDSPMFEPLVTDRRKRFRRSRGECR